MRNIVVALIVVASGCTAGVDVEVRQDHDAVVVVDGSDAPIDDGTAKEPPKDGGPTTPPIDEPVDVPDAGADDDGPVLDDSVGDGADDDVVVEEEEEEQAEEEGATDEEAPVSAACDEHTLPLVNVGIVEPAGLDGCPSGMAPIDGGICMDRWEAFVDVVTADGPAPFSPYGAIGTARVVARSAPGAVPQSNISGTQAAAACAMAGKRLCRASEWSAACRGPSSFTYPWGNDRRDGACNDARAVHPAVEYFGTSASWIWSALDHPCINQLPDSLARTGTHERCVNGSGHFDLVGNLHEWIDDSAGTFRGGFYVDTVRNGAGCLYTTTAHGFGHHDYSTGFRCCADRAAP